MTRNPRIDLSDGISDPCRRAIDLLAAGADLPPDAVEIHHGRNIVAKFAGDSLCVKSYKVPGLIKGLMYGLLRAPKSRRALLNGRELLRRGIDTPTPRASIEFRSGGRLTRSFYICDYLTTEWTFLRGAEQRPDFDILARNLARFVAELHKRRIWMKDLSQGNVLFRVDPDGSYHFALVDINRMAFDVDSHATLMSNFRALLDTEEGLARVARYYAEITDPENAEAVVNEAITRFRKHHLRIARKRRLKRLFKR